MRISLNKRLSHRRATLGIGVVDDAHARAIGIGLSPSFFLARRHLIRSCGAFRSPPHSSTARLRDSEREILRYFLQSTSDPEERSVRY